MSDVSRFKSMVVSPLRAVTISLMGVSLALATGCAPTLEEGFESDLSKVGGCGDVQMFAVDDADTELLVFQTTGLVDKAWSTGEEVTVDYLLPDASVELVVELGSKISDAICDDVIENGGPVVRSRYVATGGTATVTVTPNAEATLAFATLVLEGVSFEPEEGGEAVTVESFVIEDVMVGYLPG